VTALVLVLVGSVAVVLLGFVALARARARPFASAPAEAPPTMLVERRAVVVLDLDHAGSTGRPAERLVHEIATRIFASLPDAQEVEVRARDGSVLGRSTRVVPPPREIWLPEFLHEPHPRRHPGPDLWEHLAEDEPFLLPPREGPAVQSPTPAPRPGPPRESGRPIVERFDLVPGIRSRVRNPDDARDVVRSILQAGGLDVEVTDDLLQVNELAIVVVRIADGATHEALNHAYLQIAASGSKRGLVISLGHVDVDEIRRREMLAPHVLHTGFAGVQRMADAVALGADPIRFAVGPALAPAASGRSLEGFPPEEGSRDSGARRLRSVVGGTGGRTGEGAA